MEMLALSNTNSDLFDCCFVGSNGDTPYCQNGWLDQSVLYMYISFGIINFLVTAGYYNISTNDTEPQTKLNIKLIYSSLLKVFC